MPTVFFSWQSDVDAKFGRSFIEKALSKAIKALQQDDELLVVEADRDRDIVLDKDTKGVPGSPPIFATILQKIDAAAAFVADLTYVSERSNRHPTPNPNVLIEYGYALKSLTHNRLVGVMNTAFGSPEKTPLPFDLQHARRPILYCVGPESTDEARAEQLASLTQSFKEALKSILKLLEPTAPPGTLFEPQKVLDGAPLYRPPQSPIGIEFDSQHFTGNYQPKAIELEDGKVWWWYRIWPKFNHDRRIPATEAVSSNAFNVGLSLLYDYNSIGRLRGENGVGIYAYDDSGRTPSVAYVFETGELWVTDRLDVHDTEQVLFFEKGLFETFDKNVTYMRGYLKLPFPFCWQAGINGIRDQRMEASTPGYYVNGKTVGPSLKNAVVSVGEFADPNSRAKDILRPFVEDVYDSFGARAPDWLWRA